jgi:hypothetical protein
MTVGVFIVKSQEPRAKSQEPAAKSQQLVARFPLICIAFIRCDNFRCIGDST